MKALAPAPRLMLPWLRVLIVTVSMMADLRGREPVRPNILLILSDDQGYGDFSCFGNQVLRTPNLDQLKKESVFLSRFYVSPLCSPTRAALMTGRHQFRTGVWDTWKGRANMAGDEVTVAEYLQRAGYRTGVFGKWHLGDNHPFRPQDQGFETAFIWNNADRFHPTFSRNGETVGPFERFQSDVINDEAIRFMEERSEHPFFAYVPYFLPHSHYKKQIPDEYVEPFIKDPRVEQNDRETYAMVAKLDEDVGRLLRALEARGLYKNTLVIFLSDNGPTGRRYNCGLRGRKTSVYEGGIRVPCFVRWPERLAPGSVGDILSGLDLLPTLLAIAGQRPDGKAIDGVSFWPRLSGTTAGRPERYLFEQQQPQRSDVVPQLFTNACVIGARFKLVFTQGEATAELFDVEADPAEKTNILDAHPEMAQRMKSAYVAWFQSASTERGFQPLASSIGHPAQASVLLGHTQFNEVYGYPCRVLRAGSYRVEIQEMQPALFPEGGSIGLTDRKHVWKTAVLPNAESATMIIELEAGDTTFFPYSEGKRAMKFAYGNEDVGFRVMQITGPLPASQAQP